MNQPSAHVVVVDDIRRLALHLWHYLSQCPGFGIRDASNERKDGLFWKLSEEGEFPASLPTPEGHIHVWWVSARAQEMVNNDLAKVFQGIRGISPGPIGKHVFSLIDVRGPSRSLSKDSYSWKETIKRLASTAEINLEDIKEQTRLVSSYETGTRRLEDQRLRIYEKNGRTFEDLRKSLDKITDLRPGFAHLSSSPATGLLNHSPNRDESSHRSQKPSVAQILITGAGFEFQERISPSDSPLGLSGTSEILNRTFSNPDRELFRETKPEGECFPFFKEFCPTAFQQDLDGDPESAVEGQEHPSPYSAALQKDLYEAAYDNDLDLFWDALLALELERARSVADSSGYPSAALRKADKLRGSQAEYELRRSFRNALLEEDWGFIRQALEAGRQPFDVWLTTNYTRFSDRAIRTIKDDPLPWQIISTSNEASRHLRELLHGSREPREKKNRFLFKLHGDISHLTTMAIAGHDKEPYSPLSFPIDSLHLVYSTATQHLENLFHHTNAPQEDAKPQLAVWHIVGHSLRDHLLTQLIQRSERIHANQNIFLIVGLSTDLTSEKYSPVKILAQTLGEIQQHCFIPVSATALEYMSRLNYYGLLQEWSRQAWRTESEIRGCLKSMGLKTLALSDCL